MTTLRFGMATCDITPPFPCPMHGYSVRQDRFDRVNDPLSFTAVVLDNGERRTVIGAADICTFPNDERTPDWQRQLGAIADCPPENVVLNASHTHGGPLMPTANSISMRRPETQAITNQYADWLLEQMKQAVQHATTRMMPGTLELIEGVTDFPINRRLKVKNEIVNRPNFDGPIDSKLQLLVLRDDDGHTKVVMQRLSCHPVAVGAQHRITADFVGAWRDAFTEALGPEVTPIFLQGAGGDMRPRAVVAENGWHQASYDELPAMGRQLLRDTLVTLMDGDVTRIENLTLNGCIRDVHAECEPRYTTEAQLRPLLDSDEEYLRKYATWCLNELKHGNTIPNTSDYRAQTLWLNDEVAIVGLNVEPLIGLADKIERAFLPHKAFVLGYTNGCVSYAPDTVELQRGGYEADSYLFDGWCGPWTQGLEHAFIPQLAVQPPASARS